MAYLDISLDDMIKKNQRNNLKGDQGQSRPRRGRGPAGSSRGRRSFGVPRRNPLGANVRSSSFAITKPIRGPRIQPWHNSLYGDSPKGAGLSGLEAGTKLYISNLNFGVSNEDIRELFSKIGELVRYAIHFGKNARPSGTAEVVFSRRNDAMQAFKQYNNAQLDGRPMKIEILRTNDEIPIPPRVNFNGANENKRTTVMALVPGRSRGGFAGANRNLVQRSIGGRSNVRGGSSVRRGRGRGRGGAHRIKTTVKKSAEELDKELDSYHAEAMQF